MAYRAYNFFSAGLFVAFFPLFRFYFRTTDMSDQGLSQRIGLYSDKIVKSISGSPRIWIHAVSVGEVSVAIAIIESLVSLMPDCAIVLSTTTRSGQDFARKKLRADKFCSKTTCIYAPVDFIVSVRKALSVIKPDAMIFLETEIWPNWIIEAHKMGIKTAIVNGRISVRTIKKYLKVRSLTKEVLKHIDVFSMISEADAQRIRMIGAPAKRIEINGNAKYDLLPNQAEQDIKTKIKRLYNLNGDEPVFIAGSTRNPEEKIIIDVYRKIVQSVPETLLFIAPRHVKRVHQIQDLVKINGFSCQLRTDLDKKGCQRTESVIIMDTIGELQAIYSIASIVFCGGSLTPLGGQNILEPAVWGKPVFYGPSMEDFLDAKELLEKTGGGIQVKDGSELAERAIYYLTHPDQADIIGKSAKKAVISNKGSAAKHAAAIDRLVRS